MADDRPEDIDSSPDLGRPKRAPPTIELAATKVSEAGATTADASATPGESLPTPRVAWIASALVAAIAGSMAAVLVVAIVWLLGWPGEAASPAGSAPQADHATVDALTARVASLESRADAPSGSTPDPAAATHIDALEKSLASLREELSTSRSQSERLMAAVNDLKAAPRDASAPDLSGINERFAQIERAARAQIAESAQQNAKPADDRPLRRLVAAALLDVSVRHGEPYAAALDAAKAFAPDAGALKPLDPFAHGSAGRQCTQPRSATLLPKPAPGGDRDNHRRRHRRSAAGRCGAADPNRAYRQRRHHRSYRGDHAGGRGRATRRYRLRSARIECPVGRRPRRRAIRDRQAGRARRGTRRVASIRSRRDGGARQNVAIGL